MKKFILGLIVGLLFSTIISFASEIITDFSDNSIPVLNEELRQIRWKLQDHETRIIALEP